MRRLPIYFLIDISESMVGEQIQQVEDGLATIIKALKTDPYSIETVWVSIIVFAGQAKTLVPLQEIISFYPPKFPIGSGTSLGTGLGHLMFELRRNTVKTTYEQKGDWKPIVFLFTDGSPTDDCQKAILEWRQNWQRAANMIAVSFGDESNLSILQQLTENVLLFKNADAAAYSQFFKWVTDSIKTSSMGIENNGSGFDMANLDSNTLTKIEVKNVAPSPGYIDPNFVVVAGKCQNTLKPYLMKYGKIIVPSAFAGYNTRAYKLIGGFQVDNSYYELSDETNNPPATIHTDELIGAPACPCCGNQIAFAMCKCGKIHCIGDEPISTCPWCGNKGAYGSAGEGGFDVNRTQG